MEEEDSKCKCGKPADYGCHGIRDGKVYSEHYCEKCYNKKKMARYKKPLTRPANKVKSKSQDLCAQSPEEH